MNPAMAAVLNGVSPAAVGHFYNGYSVNQNEDELGSKMLQIQSKRFYIDVKQNRRGRFIKIAEIGADGRRSQIFLALSTATEFRDHLSSFSEFYSSLGPTTTCHTSATTSNAVSSSAALVSSPPPSAARSAAAAAATVSAVLDNGKLKSETMIKVNRRYYLDLKENSRGRFLRVSQTVPRSGMRSQIAVPAQGLIEFRDALTNLLNEFGSTDGGDGEGLVGGAGGPLPEGQQLRVDNKSFYFDVGQNERGVYMRVSEVKSNFRASITIPDKSWPRFAAILAEYAASVAGSDTVAPSSAATNGTNTVDHPPPTTPPQQQQQQQITSANTIGC